MMSGGNYITKTEIRIGEHKFETVNKFPYLGVIVQMDNDKTEIKDRINVASRCYFGLLWNKKIRV